MSEITRTVANAPENDRAFWGRLGLQFFAGEGEGDAGGGETDGFLDGLTGGMELPDDGGGDQTAGENSDGGEDGPDGGDQTARQTGEEDAGDGEEPPEGADSEGQEEAQSGGEPVVLRVMDRQVALPGDAVRALSGALGTDATALLQKGLNYENRGAREIGILSDFAGMAGMELPEYLAKLEQSAQEQRLSMEMERLRGDYPEGTPDEALETIAQNNLQARQAAQEAARAEQAAERQRAAIRREMGPFMKEHPEIRAAADVPPAVWDKVYQSGGAVSLPAAYAMYERDQARAENEELRGQLEAEKKMNENRRQTVGSQQGGGDTHDAFLAGLFG